MRRANQELPPPDFGVVFLRTDLPGANSVRASRDKLKDTTLSTFLGNGRVLVQTVEHLLAAPRIDEGAVEKLRAEQDALFVDISRRISETAVQVARTLTPEQRKALSAEIDRRMASGHHAHD